MDPRNVSEMRAAISPLVNGPAGKPAESEHPPDEEEAHLSIVNRPDIAEKFEGISFFSDLLASLQEDVKNKSNPEIRYRAQKELVRLAIEISKHMRAGAPRGEMQAPKRPKFNYIPKLTSPGQSA